MKVSPDFEGNFSEYFNSQLKTLMENGAKDCFIKLEFSLPDNLNYSSIEKNHLSNEVRETLNKFYPLGSRLVYTRPNPDNDNFFEVWALVRLPL